MRPDGIQDESRERQRTRKFKAEPDGTLRKGSAATLDNTLAIMANEASMMWEQLFHVECLRVSIRRANATLIDKLTAMIFILEAGAGNINVYKEHIKEICTWRICAEGKHRLFMAREHFAALYRQLKWDDSLFEVNKA